MMSRMSRFAGARAAGGGGGDHSALPERQRSQYSADEVLAVFPEGATHVRIAVKDSRDWHWDIRSIDPAEDIAAMRRFIAVFDRIEQERGGPLINGVRVKGAKWYSAG